MLDDIVVIDAVTHAYNFDPSNYAVPKDAQLVANLSYFMARNPPDRRFALPGEVYLSDWSSADLGNLLFRESATDLAVMHALPISAFHDGLVSVEKAAEAIERWPNRFIGAYAAVDPMLGAEALRDLERQVELLKPHGLKLYPNSWATGSIELWRMDDPKLVYPLYEKALELGIRHIAVHKAVPIGSVPVKDSYNPSDLEAAAAAFPDLNFEIVHGGMAFLDETAWLLSRFDNIYVNMEIQNIILERRPRAFAEILLGLVRIGGNRVFRRLFWGSGTTLYHPRPALEAFRTFEFPEDLLADAGLFAPIKQLTDDDKRAILGGNYARSHGIDLDAAKAAIVGDEFWREPGAEIPEPYSTISHAKTVDDWRATRV
ncbi:amidohydrolase family protein [Nocardioides humi]|uniref:Amidohydrolase family protein n=1 Tax=Nocardioides humi TaxID=449461 RepID=A0ABN1ZXA3_9ACTN|nr:amidohydrolase family protein [Nocardioides humi]